MKFSCTQSRAANSEDPTKQEMQAQILSIPTVSYCSSLIPLIQMKLKIQVLYNFILENKHTHKKNQPNIEA